MSNNRLIDTKITLRNTSKIGITARTMSIYLIITTCGLYALPNSLTNLIKPLFIYILLLETIILRKKLYFKIESWISLCFALYLFLIFLKTGINSSNFINLAPLLLNLLLFFLATLNEYNKKEIELLLNSLYWAGFIFSFIVAISNPIIGNDISRINIYYLNNSLNANGIPYLIVPSIVIGTKKLFNSHANVVNRIIVIFTLFVMLYTIFYTSTRGAILALLISLFLLVFKYILRNIKDRRILAVLLLSIFVFFCSIVVLYLLPEKIVNRAFNFSSYSLNSRDQLWRLAISLSKNNICFGNGFDYWAEVTGSPYGAHNLFLDLLVSSGILGSLMMILLVSIIVLKSKNVLLLSLLTAPIMNSLFEAGRTYDFWNPLILCVLIYSSTYYKSSEVVRS